MVASTISIEEWVAATTFVKYRKLCTLKENCSLRLNTVTYKVKMFLGQLLWITVFSYSTAVSLRFLYICQQFTAACYFSIYKLIGWDLATFNCSK